MNPSCQAPRMARQGRPAWPPHTPARPLVAVLLLYYQAYAEQALAALQQFLRPLGGASRVVVVCNGSWAPRATPPGVDVLPGDNHQREFSGWDVGLRHLRAHGLLPRDGLLVLANDTFSLHNRFGRVTQRCFVQAFQQLAALEGPGMAGEAYGLAQPYAILGLQAPRWVSTHLFAMNAALVERLPGLGAPAGDLQSCYVGRGASLRLSTAVSRELAGHIEDWLLGRGRRHWYGSVRQAGATQPTLAALRGKCDTILLEKLLSARCAAAGGQLIDAMASPTQRLLRRLERPLLAAPLRAGHGQLPRPPHGSALQRLRG